MSKLSSHIGGNMIIGTYMSKAQATRVAFGYFDANVREIMVEQVIVESARIQTAWRVSVTY